MSSRIEVGGSSAALYRHAQLLESGRYASHGRGGGRWQVRVVPEGSRNNEMLGHGPEQPGCPNCPRCGAQWEGSVPKKCVFKVGSNGGKTLLSVQEEEQTTCRYCIQWKLQAAVLLSQHLLVEIKKALPTTNPCV